MNGKIRAVLLLGVMYGLGVVSGIAWQTYRGHHFIVARAYFAERRVKRLKSQLHLTDAQEKSIRDIFEKAHLRATQINEEVSWDLADIHHDSVQAIRQVLTPEQAVEFDKLHHQFHAHHGHVPDDPEESTMPVRAPS